MTCTWPRKLRCSFRPLATVGALLVALALECASPCLVSAAEKATAIAVSELAAPSQSPEGTSDSAAGIPENMRVPALDPVDPPRPNLDWESGAGKSYKIPAIEVPLFLTLLNVFDRVVYHDEWEDGKRVYSSTLQTTWDHLRYQNWQFDKDPFNANQFQHPYQGAIMYGLARTTGLGFWESFAYSNVGSFLWEMGGETTPPSVNDILTTGTAGSLLGEALFRISSLVLEHGGENPPDAVHELGGALILPPTGVNRFVFGSRFRTPFPSHDPAHFWQARFGVSLDANINGVGSALNDIRKSSALDYAMSYGLPGKAGYSYDRPLDYFDFRVTALVEVNNPIESVLLRGLLYGKEYEAGKNYRGVWGIYGSYDYISPFVFRVSTTAGSLGTTGQLWLSPKVALQNSLLIGVGFGAAGKTPVPSGERDYHYGLTPQGILDLRLIFGERAMLGIDCREYYVTDVAPGIEGTERIFRGNAGLTVRLWRRHGIGVQYVASVRNAHYGNLPNAQQTEGTVSLFYTFLGDRRFGAVEWREP